DDDEKVGLIAVVSNDAVTKHADRIARTQTFRNMHVVHVHSSVGIDSTDTTEERPAFEDAVAALREAACSSVVILDPRDYYGPDYVLDLVHTLRWADVPAAGHHEYYGRDSDDATTPLRHHIGTAYTAQSTLAISRSLVRIDQVLSWGGGDPGAIH